VSTPHGVVFNIQRYSIHDGPGIRTLVFLKGCPLRCLWCDNPESQCKTPEVVYSEHNCINCGTCIDVCTRGSLSATAPDPSGKWRLVIDRSRCNDCGDCVANCPSTALRMTGRVLSVGEVMAEVEKDRAFYRSSGGGVTLSGGEPTAQAEFATALLKQCQERGIHTAIETCGYASWAEMSEMLQYVDLVLYDLKHMNPATHRELTGVSNQTILRNAKKIAVEGIPMAVRFPIVPGYTDGEENIEATARFVAQLRGVSEIHLVPYHNLGEIKYKGLGREYPLVGTHSPDESDLEKHMKTVRSHGLTVQVGG